MRRVYVLIALLALMLAGVTGGAFASEIETEIPNAQETAAAKTAEPETVETETAEPSAGASPEATAEAAEETPTPAATPAHPLRIASETGVFELEMGAKLQLSVDTQGMEVASVRWTSSHPEIAYVSGGRVIGVSEGKARIRADYVFADAQPQRAASAMCEVRVNAPGELSVSAASGAQIVSGGEMELTVELKSADVRNVKIRWESSDPAVAVVEHGRVRGVAPGSAVITALCEYVENGVEREAEYSRPVEIAGIELRGVPETAMQVGETGQLSAAMVGRRAGRAAFSWTTSDAQVVRVSEDGMIEAIAPGLAEITAICDYSDGGTLGSLRESVQIAVGEPVKFEVISETGGARLNVGDTLKLAASGSGEALEDYSIAWESRDEQIAVVDANGCVTGVAAGSATVVACIEYVCGGEPGECTIPFELTVEE